MVDPRNDGVGVTKKLCVILWIDLNYVDKQRRGGGGQKVQF